ncbi:MAG: hypothetical protein AAF593_01240 [Planctomycetota bacterium]
MTDFAQAIEMRDGFGARLVVNETHPRDKSQVMKVYEVFDESGESWERGFYQEDYLVKKLGKLRKAYRLGRMAVLSRRPGCGS